MKNDTLLEYFPFESFRKGQRESIDKIINAFEKGYKYVILDAGTGSGKALSLDTKIPTPTGFTTMGDLNIGDEVFDEKGNVCHVVTKSDVFKNHDCYEISFVQGEKIIADANHKWMVETAKDRKQKKGAYSILTTEEMFGNELVFHDNRKNYSVKLCEPIHLPDVELPIEPYILGLWLGDGCATKNEYVTNDIEVLDAFRNDGWEVTNYSAKYHYGICGGFFKLLEENNLVDNKHIPKEYLRGSYNQRLSLIQGLMDSDGHISEKGTCEITLKNKNIIYRLKELLCSIGIKVNIIETYKKATNSNQPLTLYYELTFTTDKPVFRLQRHLDRLPSKIRPTQHRRYIESIKKVKTVPTQCITVDSESHLFLCGESFIPTHNSSVARTVVDYFKMNGDFDAYILSSTKMLQNQYYEESLLYNKFNIDYQVGKGRGNFDCKINHDNCSKGECRITTDKGFKCKYGLHDAESWDIGCMEGNCPYWQQKMNAVFSDVCILNYDVLLSDFPNHYKNRKLMICDEAHNIDTKIMNRVSITLSESSLGEYGVFLENEDFYEKNTNVKYWIKRLNEIKDILVKNHSEGYMITDDSHEIYFSKNQLNDINHMIDKIRERLNEIKENPNQWFIDIVEDSHGKKITIKPIDVHNYVKPYLLDKAEYHLLMSGSIVDYKNFAKYLGLNEDEVIYIQQESTFDNVNNNPLIPKYCGKLTYKEKNNTLPKAYSVIDEIITTHMDEKGIIHCNSKEFANKILENCWDNGRFITYENSFEKELAIKELQNSENKIIVSYSLEEGLNLPDDDIRFQILLKCPYPSLADKQIKARQKADYTWYLLETIRKIIQTVGRGMRHENDYCKNYLIDTSFKTVLKNKYCPKYIKDSVQKKKLLWEKK